MSHIDKYLLVEKFRDRRLSEEEQQYIVDECERNEEFNRFWNEALENISAAEALRSTKYIEESLAKKLSLKVKFPKKKKKKSSSFLFYMAAIMALSFAGFWTYKNYFKKYHTAEVAYSTIDTYPKGQDITAKTAKISMGLIQVDYNGSKVVIEGPAEFTFTKDNSLYINKGHVFIDASLSDGLVVNVNDRVFEDIGTKFGILVNKKSSEVHVFEGKVKSEDLIVSKGNALKITDSKIQKTYSKRGAFTSPDQIHLLEKKKELYSKSRKMILNSKGLISYYDFMELNNLNINKLKKQGLSFSRDSIAPGPYAGSTSISFNNERESLQIPIPSGQFYMLIEYKFKTFKENILFLRSNTNGISYNHEMNWYKATFWDKKKNIMIDSFYEWRNISFLKSNSVLNVYNDKYKIVQSIKTSADAGQKIIFGMEEQTNFEGRIARIGFFSIDSDFLKIAKYFEVK